MSATLPTATHAQHLCYVREFWSYNWVEKPLLRCHTVSDQAAPAHATGQFSYRYGKAMLPAIGTRDADLRPVDVPPGSLTGFYVKVVIDTDPVTTWYGILLDVSTDRTGDIDDTTPSGCEHYTAYGLTILLEKSRPITKSIATKSGGTTEIDVAIPFNGGTDGKRSRKRVASGNYDATQKCFTSDDFGTPVKWTAEQALFYLLENFAPTAIDDSQQITFLITESSGLQYTLPLLQYDGQSLWQIINRLISRQRGLGFHAIVNGSDEVELVPFSLSSSAISMPSGGTIPANSDTNTIDISNALNIQHVDLTTSSINYYDQVIARGARLGAVFSVAPLHNLVEDWSPASETDYNDALGTGVDETEDDAAANADYRARDALHDVFADYKLKTSWAGTSITLSDQSEPLAVYSIDDDGTVDTDTLGPLWRPGLRVSKFLPLRKQVDYSGAITPDDDDHGEDDYLAPFVCCSVPISGGDPRWLYGERLDAAADIGSGDREHSWTVQTRIRDDAPGLTFQVVGGQQHYMAADRYIPNGDFEAIPSDEGTLDLDDKIATVYMPLQQRVFARMPASPTSGDVARTLVIDVPDAYLDRLTPGTVVDVDSDGALVEAAGGWLRDDRQRLQDIATIAHTWYSVNRQAFSLSFRTLTTAYTVGQLITSLITASGSESVNTVITAISLNLDSGTTALRTQFDELDFGAMA